MNNNVLQVVVHPLVLLSVVDHYTRVAKDTRKRVVGVLLGQVSRGRVDITNSYAVPFEVRLGLKMRPRRSCTSHPVTQNYIHSPLHTSDLN